MPVVLRFGCKGLTIVIVGSIAQGAKPIEVICCHLFQLRQTGAVFSSGGKELIHIFLGQGFEEGFFFLGIQLPKACASDYTCPVFVRQQTSHTLVICAIPYSFDGQFHSIDQPFGEFGNVMCIARLQSLVHLEYLLVAQKDTAIFDVSMLNGNEAIPLDFVRKLRLPIVFVLFLVLDSSIFEVFFIGSVLLCEVINGPSPGAQPKLFSSILIICFHILKHLKKLVNQSIAFLIIAEGETVSAVAVSPQPLNIVPNLYALQFLADIKRQTHLL